MNKGRVVGMRTASGIFEKKRPIWAKAIEKQASNGNTIRIPLDMGNIYIKPRGVKGILPVSSLHYLMMYKDKSNSVHAEWVNLIPDSAWLYGQREVFTGKITVRSWEGRFIKGYIATHENVTEYVGPYSQEINTVGEQGLRGNVQKKIVEGGDGDLDPNCDYYYYEDDDHTPHLLFSICYSPFAPCLNCPTEAEDHFEDDTDPDNYGGGGVVTTYYDYQPNCETDITSTGSAYSTPTGVQWNIDCTGVPLIIDKYICTYELTEHDREVFEQIDNEDQ